MMVINFELFILSAITIFSGFTVIGEMTILNAQTRIEDLLLPGMEKGIKGDYQGAITQFTAVIRRYPNQPEAYYNRGIARAKIGDRKGAIADYNQAVRLNPNFAEAYAERGLLYGELGNQQAAITDWQKAAKLFWHQKNYAAYQQIIHKLDQLTGH